MEKLLASGETRAVVCQDGDRYLTLLLTPNRITQTGLPVAKRIVEQFVDDLDKTSEADETVRYSIDGVDREIDLTKQNADDFRKLLEPYIAVSRRVGGRRTRGSAKPSSGQDNQKIREWANANGVTVSARGRIAQSVVDQYESAQTGA